jgi:hypothetical protein
VYVDVKTEANIEFIVPSIAVTMLLTVWELRNNSNGNKDKEALVYGM